MAEWQQDFHGDTIYALLVLYGVFSGMVLLVFFAGFAMLG